MSFEHDLAVAKIQDALGLFTLAMRLACVPKYQSAWTDAEQRRAVIPFCEAMRRAADPNLQPIMTG